MKRTYTLTQKLLIHASLFFLKTFYTDRPMRDYGYTHRMDYVALVVYKITRSNKLASLIYAKRP